MSGEAFRALAESVAMGHTIGESFFGGGSEAQVLNFAAQIPVAGAPAAGLATGRPARRKLTDLSGCGTDWSPGLSPTVSDKCVHWRENQPAVYQQYIAARQDLACFARVSGG